MALTARQMKFCEEYALHGNARRSYMIAFENDNISASDVGANKLLKRDDINEEIRRIRAESLKQLGDKGDFLGQQLLDDINWRSEDGKKSPTWAKSCELFSKMYGLQQMKLDIDQKTEVVINID